MGKALRRATRAAHAAALPERQALRREGRDARHSLSQGQAANEAGYGALDRTLSDIGNDYRGAYRRLGSDYSRSVAGLGNMLNVGGVGGEMAVGGAGFGGIAASGTRGLAQQRARGIEYTASTRRQGAIEEKTNALNLLNEFHNRMKELSRSRQDLAARESAAVTTSLPAYREQVQSQRLARRWQEWLDKKYGSRGGSRGDGGAGDGGQHASYGSDITPALQGQLNSLEQAPRFEGTRTPHGFAVPGAGVVPEPAKYGPPGVQLAAPGAYMSPQIPQGLAPPLVSAPPPTPAAQYRDPFQPQGQAAPQQQVAAPAAASPNPGYWYTDPATQEQMYSSGAGEANNATQELAYWQQVLSSTTDPAMKDAVMRRISELQQLVGSL